MNILFVLENYWPHIGGVETVFENLAKGLVKAGNRVTILTSRIKGTKKEETKDGYKILRVSVPYIGWRYWFSFLAIPQASKLAKDADIIHTTTYNGSLPAKIGSILQKKPIIITIHEILGRNWKGLLGINSLNAGLHQLLERLIILIGFDRFVCVSESTRRSLLQAKVKRSKTDVIYNGIDYDHFNPKNYDSTRIKKSYKLDKRFIYTSYGRPGITKGIEYLIQAVPEITARVPGSALLLILSKSPKGRYDHIVQLIDKLGIREQVILVPPKDRKALPAFIKASDCVVVPSLTEGFGFTAAEACAMDIPVVASDTTSLPEVVSGRFVLVKPKDPLAIAQGVEKIFKKKWKKTKKKLFTTDDNVKGYLDVYNSLIK